MCLQRYLEVGVSLEHDGLISLVLGLVEHTVASSRKRGNAGKNTPVTLKIPYSSRKV